jgi:hypothetical protein
LRENVSELLHINWRSPCPLAQRVSPTRGSTQGNDAGDVGLFRLTIWALREMTRIETSPIYDEVSRALTGYDCKNPVEWPWAKRLVRRSFSAVRG